MVDAWQYSLTCLLIVKRLSRHKRYLVLLTGQVAHTAPELRLRCTGIFSYLDLDYIYLKNYKLKE